MDKYEYKLKLDEIKSLAGERKYEEAAAIVDTINWRKVRNVNSLVKAGEVYAQVGRYEEGKEILLMAYDRSPIGRMIIYQLAEIAVKQKNFDEANEYYDEFVEIAPHDSLKYVIKYRLNEARGADDTTLIAILEEQRSHDLIEEWLFELACLYRKTAQVEKCIEICDEIELWFGDGPYVEKALEMKLLYQPLDKQQEDKYRHFRQKRDGITEITPEENYGGSEIINRPITIPQIEEKPEQFDTVNLQAAIKRNIEEIMQATEAGEISENMEAIKDLVDEIPYLKVTDDNKDFEQERQKQRKEDREIAENLMNRFSEYLAEEYDGQMSLLIPDADSAHEAPIAGQLTIEEVIDRWERTKRAAEAALMDAEADKLEQAKAKALAEANQIMDRLNEAIPKLDAGATPSELLEEEIMNRADEAPAQKEDKKDSDSEKKTFAIPKVAAKGEDLGVGLEIPVITAASGVAAAEAVSAAVKAVDTEGPEILTEEEVTERTSDWKPPVFEEDRKDEVETEAEPAESETKAPEAEEALAEEVTEEKADDTTTSATEPGEEKTGDVADTEDELAGSETVSEGSAEGADAAAEAEPEDKPEEEAKPAAETAGKVKAKAADKPTASAKAEKPGKKEAEGSGKMPAKLSADEKEIFSYFTPIKGMEKKLVDVLNVERGAYGGNEIGPRRHVIIQGGKGSGKTTLATSIVKVLQNEGLMGSRALGKIEGTNLNEKNIRELFDKIRSGALIVENAGSITRDTAVTLSLLLDSDTSGILLLMEDSRLGVDKLLSLNPNFTAKFTDRLEIPPLTIDELVNFGKTYAGEMGYTIDETAVLALYDRINLISGVGHPMYLTGVKEIVDSAIDKAEHRKGFFGIGGKKYDMEGRLILKEKDFDE